MNFRTIVPITEEFPKIDYHSKIFLMGSCFVENIGEKLEWYKLQNLQNPLGIIFHPSPMADFFRRMRHNESFTKADVFEYNAHWQSYEAHSNFRSTHSEEVLLKLNKSLQHSISFVKSATHIIISLGTAWGYNILKTDKIAANCHKVPQKHFKKELSSVKEIVGKLKEIIEATGAINEDCNVLFTVSPVRHLKDGFVENQLSKARLLIAVHEIIRIQNNLQLRYFPSYEIMMDDLRDYRFYKEDMLHPSAEAVNYIWDRFSNSILTKEALSFSKEIDDIQKAILHRPRAENSKRHKKFLTKLKENIEEIQRKLPEISFP